MTKTTKLLCAVGSILFAGGLAGAQPIPPAQPPGTAQPAQTAQPAPPPSECVPACRSGFICNAGLCISACNPPCAAGETCTPEASCVPNAPAPAPQGWGDTAAPAPMPAPAGPPPSGWAAPTEEPAPVDEPKGLVLLPRLAFLVGGSGTIEQEISGDYYGTDSFNTDYDDESGLALGFELLYHLGPSFRLGGGLFYVTKNEVDPEDASNFDSGSDLAIVGIPEGLFRVGPSIFIAVRGTLGLLTLWPGADLQSDIIDDWKDRCDYGDCTVYEGPYFGYLYGVGAGIVFSLGVIRLRGDLLIQGYSISTDMVTGDSVDFTYTYSASGTRYWLSFGLEF